MHEKKSSRNNPCAPLICNQHRSQQSFLKPYPTVSRRIIDKPHTLECSIENSQKHDGTQWLLTDSCYCIHYNSFCWWWLITALTMLTLNDRNLFAMVSSAGQQI